MRASGVAAARASTSSHRLRASSIAGSSSPVDLTRRQLTAAGARPGRRGNWAALLGIFAGCWGSRRTNHRRPPAAREALLVVSDDGRVRRVVEPLLALGYTAHEDLRGRLVTDLTHPEDRGVVANLLRAVRGDGPAAGPPGGGHPGPPPRRALGAAGRVGPGRPSRSHGRRRGPARRRRQRHAPAAGGSPLPGMAPLADALATGILAADRPGRSSTQRAAAELFWMDGAALLEHGWLAPVHIDDLEEVRAAAAAALSGLAHQDVTFQLWIDADHPRWVHARFSGLRTATGRNGWVAALEDITSRHAAEHELSFQATHDTLTGLPDRLLLPTASSRASPASTATTRRSRVLFIDLDGFKAVNDGTATRSATHVLVEVAAPHRRGGPAGRHRRPAWAATSSWWWPTTSTRRGRSRSPSGSRPRSPARSRSTTSRSRSGPPSA